MVPDSQIVNLLLSCEKAGPAYPYGEPVVRLDSGGRDVFIVSDLHLSSGKDGNGKFSGLENFFYDVSFERFLSSAEKWTTGRGALLVINGDFIDFLRIKNVPARDDEFDDWAATLRQIGMAATAKDLQASVSDRERTYGFKTSEQKSVWRAARAVAGHPQFFNALANWLSEGHRLVIVKGNHDLEWYWPGVRNYLRLALARRLHAAPAAGAKDLMGALKNEVLPHLIFADNAVVIDDISHIEHGHRFDRYSHVVGDQLLKNRRELNLPFGSFLNRYLINQIELTYPFLDNVRPRENLLPLLFREHFFLGLEVLFKHLPFVLNIIPKRYFRYMFGRLLLYALPVLFLAGAAIMYAVHWLHNGTGAAGLIDFFSAKSTAFLMVPVKLLAVSALGYFFTRMVAYFHLAEADSLADNAREILERNPEYRFVTFGHTHNPDQCLWDNRRYSNSGTWIPVIELSSAAIRYDRTFAFLHLSRDSTGKLVCHDLKRWNDDAARDEAIIVVNRKES